MPLAHNYTDAYLGKHITEEFEARATADVAELGDLPDEWRARLVVTRAYILIALEKGTDAEIWAVKLTNYRKEWSEMLAQARSAQAATQAAGGSGIAGAGAGGWSINLERC